MGEKNSFSVCLGKPQTRYEPKSQFCPSCSRLLYVEKSRVRRLVTPTLDEDVTEIIKKCCSCDEVRFVSEGLRQLTPVRSPYSYDVIVHLGFLRYCQHRQISEIQREIASKGLTIPRTSIQRLCLRFLKYFIAVHLESFPLLVRITCQQGGYILQIDGSQNHGRGALIVVKDSISGMRLFVARFPSENKEDLVPFLEYLKSVFGMPLIIIRDGGGAIVNALSVIFPGVYQLYCHFHFLRAVGHALFDHYQKRFKKAIDRLGVKGKLSKLYRLVQKLLRKERKPFVREILEDLCELLEFVLNCSGEGLGYPFEIPILRFYERCLVIEKPVHDLVRHCAKHYVLLKVLCDVKSTLRLLHPPPAVRGRLYQDAERILEREKWFMKARKALRWRNGPVPLSTQIQWSDNQLKKARNGIDDFLAEIESKNKKLKKSSSLAKGLCIIKDRFIEHKENLLAPNIQIDTSHGVKVIKVDRTNNGVEKDFRAIRRHARRLRGDKNVEGIIQREGVGLLLLLNMDIPQYVQMVYGSWELMGERFARVGEQSLERAELLLKGYNPWWAL